MLKPLLPLLGLVLVVTAASGRARGAESSQRPPPRINACFTGKLAVILRTGKSAREACQRIRAYVEPIWKNRALLLDDTAALKTNLSAYAVVTYGTLPVSVVTIDTSRGDSPVSLSIAASLGPVAAVGDGEATRLAAQRHCSKSGHMFHSVLLPDAVTDGVFFDVEANFGLRWLRRRLQQGAELLEDFPQRHIMNPQRFVYLGQASEKDSTEETLKPEMLKH